jgi:transposase
MGMGIKSISSAFHISRNTVRKYVRRYQESGLSADRLLAMSEDHLQEMFVTGQPRGYKPSPRRAELEALLPEYAKRLSRKGTTVKSLYEEYTKNYPGGYKSAQFETLLRRYRLQTKVIGHVEHLAGDQMYIDFAGDKLQVVDAITGEVSSVEVFVAILPCSQLTYCEAVWSQKKEDLIGACENALRFFGGAPMAIVPDNLKSAVTRSDRNEPVINEEFASFAEFYNCAVYPARVRHPKDKALVENAVKLMYKSVYADMDGQTFHDLASLNAAIMKSLEAFNNRKLTGRKQSRRSLFEEIEAEYLQPLPALRYQMKARKTATVMRNSYVTLNKHHYSMPKEYIGKRVDIIYDADTLEIFHGLKLVTTHHRDDTPYGYTQKASHNLPGRHGSYERDMEEIYTRAASIDNILLVYLREVAAQKKYPPLVFKVCRGIMSLEKKYGLERLVAACACASQARLYGYNEVNEILERGDDIDFMPSSDTAPGEDNPASPTRHKNIRGRDYYTSHKTNNPKKNGNGNQ